MSSCRIINGFAGTGKTTYLLDLIKKAKKSEKANIYLSFNKHIIESGARDLPKNWGAATLHSMAYGTLTKGFISRTFNIVSDKYRHRLPKEYAKAITKSIHDLGIIDLKNILTTLGDDTNALQNFLDNFGNMDSSLIDLSEIFSLCELNGLKNTTEYGTIIVDEFQDCTIGMLNYLHNLKCDNIIFAGDEYQGIYQFSGALYSPIHSIKEVFKTTTEVEYLTSSYRVPQDICDIINSYNILETPITSTNPNKENIKMADSFEQDHLLIDTVLVRYNKEKALFKSIYPYYKGAISTIHAAKGLEFNNIAIFNFAGLVETDFTNPEYFNIFYTAITRTKKGLYLL